MRGAQGYTRIVIRLTLRPARQGKYLAGNLHLATVGMVGNVHDLPSIEIAAVIVHLGISRRRICAQNMIKHDQRLNDEFPGRLSNVLETADLSVDIVRSGGLLQQPAATLGNLLEQDQLQHGDQRPQLSHLKYVGFLKGLKVISEALFAKLIGCADEIVLSDCRYSGNNDAVASTNLGKRGRHLEGCTSIFKFCFQEESGFMQQSEVVGRSLVRLRFQ